MISLVLAAGGGAVAAVKLAKKPTASPASTTTAPAAAPVPAPAVTTDPFKQKQPLGDGKVTTSGPEKGYVYSCTSNFRGGGASHTGDWIEGTLWDPTKKLHVQGNVAWPSAKVTITQQGNQRVVSSNDLPDHNTGIFPIQSSDPAYQIDRNPNSIKAQSELFRLPLSPAPAAQPSCTGLGAIGVMTNGVLLFNALDDGGRDAVAHEVQDSCDGHPQMQGAYHYHGFSPCFKSSAADSVIGYALDGFAITGPKKADGSYYSTDDLDACHGTVSPINWGGQTVSIYHYVMTADYPYSIGCFMGTPVKTRP